jgi:hypothetical protein
MVWNNSQPTPTQAISNGQSTILNNFQYLGNAAGNDTNGYYKLPNGLIIQWGGDVQMPTGSSGQPVVTFNTNFSSAWYSITMTVFTASSSNVGLYCVDSGFSASLTQFRYRFSDFTSGQRYIFMWMAIGE